ncbi:uncharacterized protein N7459_003589 [Penicillium hispanicum]|uniref:uncharacterized protein n=1 Tax=Penicillium hispanicum TaxID=1080232 RepID=UPI002540099D|nr:uncharacterized protein N7459_003589 [Penicillium hispanicum]KAJ5587824.1 hypothetical protein N7459_003589 [Penicillium hispanicum]
MKALLNNTPSIPRSSSNAAELAESDLSLEGFSKWSVPSDKSSRERCGLPPIKEAVPRRVYVGSSSPNTGDLSVNASKLPIFQSSLAPDARGNYLAILVLGWSYVVSARLIELRRTSSNDKLVYTDCTAFSDKRVNNSASDGFRLEIGSNNHAEIRWWAAVLAAGRGWSATLRRENRDYYSVWEFHLNSSPFWLSHPTDLALGHSNEPASSSKAQEYLISFARVHDCFDQLAWAFAAALTLPEPNRFGARVTLPMPTKGPVLCRNTEQQYGSQIPSISELSHYMVLSGTSGLITSCLFGSFWEPGIPCNLASQWLNPPLHEVFPPFLQSKEYHTIVSAMSVRRPNVAPLWLGAAITGLLPQVFQIYQVYVIPAACLEAVAWTASPQSFMVPASHRRVPIHIQEGLEMIPREDEFRILFATDNESTVYGEPPISPYPPFGWVSLKDTSLEQFSGLLLPGGLVIVCLLPRSSLSAIHRRLVAAFSQLGRAFSSIMSAFGPATQQLDDDTFNEEFSELSTRSVFSWTFFTDGIRPEERDIWNHEWLEILLRRQARYDTSSSSSSDVEMETNGHKNQSYPAVAI